MKELADALRAEIDRASSRFREWDDLDATRDRGEGKWVRKEILGHLIDSAANNHQRFVRARFSSPLVSPGYDQIAWVEVHRYRERPWRELVELWAALNRHIALIIEATPPDRLSTPCQVGSDGPVSLEELMRDYLRHLRHHLAQME